MSIINCEYCNQNFDTDFTDECECVGLKKKYAWVKTKIKKYEKIIKTLENKKL